MTTTLTDQEIEAARKATFDLGPGYPQITLPPYLRSAYLDRSVDEVSLVNPSEWTPARQAAVDAGLEAAVREMLMLPAASYDSVSAALSGSVALDRALVAALAMSGGPTIDVITTTPSIDIMPLFLGERSHVVTRYAHSRDGHLDPDAVLREIAATRDRGPVVLLTSPENPTGEVWSAEDLKAIGDACFRAGGILVVDHTFLTAGVHGRADVDGVWQAFGAGENWIAIWDTGKTLGLNGDKLGFLVSGSERVTAEVRRSLSVMQYDVPRRQKVLFAELLRRAARMDYAGHLNAICHRNLAVAGSLAAAAGVRVRRPPAGSLLLLELPDGDDDERARCRLLRAGVGVVAGNVFFHAGPRPRTLLRIALARDVDYFTDAFSLLLHHLTEG